MQRKSAIILQSYHPHLSDFCSRPRLTQPYNHIIILVLPKFILSFLKVSVVSADITISGMFHTFTIILCAKKIV